MTNTKNSNILPIIMMFFLFAMISFVTGLSNPMGVIVKNQPGIANWMSQLGNFANFIAYLFMGIPAGIILKKKGYKFTALMAIAIGITGVGLQLVSANMTYAQGDNFTPIFVVYLFGALVSGFSMCMLNTVVNPMLNILGGGGNKGNQLIQFGGTLNSLSATIVPILGGYLIGNAAKATLKDATPALLIAIAIFVTAFIVLSFVKIPEPHLVNNNKNKSTTKDPHSALSFRHFILGIIAIFFYVGIEVGIPNFINLFLTNAKDAALTPGMGLDAGTAGIVVGTYWLLMLVGRFLGGILGGKFSARAQLSFVASLAIIFIVAGIFISPDVKAQMPVFSTSNGFGLQTVPFSVMLFALCGLCTSIMWGGIFNIAVEGLGKYTEMASGIFMVMVCGGGVLPVIQGRIADITNSYLSSYWVIVAALLYLLYYGLIGHKNVNTDIDTSISKIEK